MVQNKLHYAIHRHTVAEVIVERTDHKKEYMGLTIWKKAPMSKIVKTDVSITAASEKYIGLSPVR